MAFKEISPKLQLSFDEYVETWCSIIMEYYSRGVESEITNREQGYSEEEIISYSMEFSAILLIIAIRIWKSRTQISEDVRGKVSLAIVNKFYKDLYGDKSGELREEYIRFFDSRYNIFSRICINLTNRDVKKSQHEFIGMARYLESKLSKSPEEDNVEAIKRISMLLMDAAVSCFRLSENSARDIQMLGKTKFIVQKY